MLAPDKVVGLDAIMKEAMTSRYLQTPLSKAQVAELVEKVQGMTGGAVEIAYVDQGYTGEAAAHVAEQAGTKLKVVKHKEAIRGFLLLPRRWVVERSLGWLGRFRRLARDYERLTETREGWHWLAFVALLLASADLKSA